MEHLTLSLFVLAVTLSCGLAYVTTSSMKCECTCSPINNPSSKYFAVGNFEASLKPKTEMKTTSTTDAVTRLENKIPAVPPELKEYPFKEVDSIPKRERYNYMNNDQKESSVNIIKKRTTVPIVNTYSSKPVVYSSYRSTTYGFVSPTSATILPNKPIQLKISPPSAARTAVRQVSQNTTELKDDTLNEIIDTKRIDEISKTKALTLDDIIFGKVPFDFGTRGIQRIALTDSEIKALKDQPDAQKSSTMNASKMSSTMNASKMSSTMIASQMTKMSTTGATPSETAAATEFIVSEATASKMAALEQKR